MKRSLVREDEEAECRVSHAPPLLTFLPLLFKYEEPVDKVLQLAKGKDSKEKEAFVENEYLFQAQMEPNNTGYFP